MLMVFKMVSPNVRVISVGHGPPLSRHTARPWRMHGGGRTREGRGTIPGPGGEPWARGPESYLYYTLWEKVARFGWGFIFQASRVGEWGAASNSPSQPRGGWTVTTGLLLKRWSQGVAQRRVQTKNIHRTTDFKIVYLFLKLLGWDQTKKYTLKGWFGNCVYKNRNQTLISFVKLKKYIHDFRMKPSVSISHRNFRFLQKNSCTRFLNSALRV